MDELGCNTTFYTLINLGLPTFFYSSWLTFRNCLRHHCLIHSNHMPSAFSIHYQIRGFIYMGNSLSSSLFSKPHAQTLGDTPCSNIFSCHVFNTALSLSVICHDLQSQSSLQYGLLNLSRLASAFSKIKNKHKIKQTF